MKRTYTMSLALFSFFCWKIISGISLVTWVTTSAQVFCYYLSIGQKQSSVSQPSLPLWLLTHKAPGQYTLCCSWLVPDTCLFLCPRGDYRTSTTLWSNRAGHCNIRFVPAPKSWYCCSSSLFLNMQEECSECFSAFHCAKALDSLLWYVSVN